MRISTICSSCLTYFFKPRVQSRLRYHVQRELMKTKNFKIVNAGMPKTASKSCTARERLTMRLIDRLNSKFRGWQWFGDSFKMLVAKLLCWWLFSVINRSPASQSCHQHILSPTSFTNIYVITSWFGDSDVGDIVMLVTLWWWPIWDVGARITILVTFSVISVIFECIKSVTNILNRSPTS